MAFLVGVLASCLFVVAAVLLIVALGFTLGVIASLLLFSVLYLAYRRLLTIIGSPADAYEIERRSLPRQ